MINSLPLFDSLTQLALTRLAAGICGLLSSCGKSKRSVTEERAGRKLGGLRVLSSYWFNEASTYKYYEVILVVTAQNAIKDNPRIDEDSTYKYYEVILVVTARYAIKNNPRINEAIRRIGHRTEPHGRETSPNHSADTVDFCCLISHGVFFGGYFFYCNLNYGVGQGCLSRTESRGISSSVSNVNFGYCACIFFSYFVGFQTL
ncbi:hypothetical protein SOVF_098520 isoform B [Spinacia oleracea]|nr:hypothetical protein SOVF_098520 isoform B [Spinacia oleracea]